MNQFGRRLFETFFRSYTEKVWGMPCTEISADWAAQRIRGLSLREVVKAALGGNRQRHASLIEQFQYPRRGPSMMWEAMAERVIAGGGELHLGAAVQALEHQTGRVTQVVTSQGALAVEGAAVSSMPLRDLVLALRPEPPA